MDVNSRINWKAGMELTANVFLDMDRHIDYTQQVAMQSALGGRRMGLLPEVPFNNKGVFVRNTFEIEHFRCMALLPSGRIIDADEPAVVTIPMLYGNVYYLAVGIGEGYCEFEKEGVPCVRPQYVYNICTLEDLANGEWMPVVRFKASEGVFSVDADYIPPTLQPVCDNRIQPYIDSFIEHLDAIASHNNLVDEFGKRAMLHFLFVLKSCDKRMLTSELILLLQEIVQAIDYFIIRLVKTGHEGEEIEHEENENRIVECNQYDVENWLKWLDGYMVSALSVLDGYTPEDKSIDFEELKNKLKQELYEQVVPELHDRLVTELKESITRDLGDRLTQSLTEYMEKTLKPALFDELKQELSDNLYKKLYDSLYETLMAALYVPREKEEEEVFMPMI